PIIISITPNSNRYLASISHFLHPLHHHLHGLVVLGGSTIRAEIMLVILGHPHFAQRQTHDTPGFNTAGLILFHLPLQTFSTCSRLKGRRAEIAISNASASSFVSAWH